MRFNHTILLIVFTTLAINSSGQSLSIVPDLRFENLNTEQNFTTGYIGNLTVDKKGYLWAAGNGLFRFDGMGLQHFTNFNNQHHGLRHNYCDDLVTDKWGRLWIGNGLGLCYYNDTLGKFIYINKDPATPITYAYSFLLEGNDLWFVSNLGLARLNLISGIVSETSLKEFANTIELFPLRDSVFAVSSRAGLYLYDRKNNTWKKKTFTYQGNPVRIRECIFSNNKYWAATNVGLWRIEDAGESMTLVPNTTGLNISALVIHPLDKEKKYIWCSTTNKGLQLFNTVTNSIEYEFYYSENNPHSLNSNNITSLHVDNLQRIWMGTEKGISIFDHSNQYLKTRRVIFTEGITADNQVNKIVQDSTDRTRVWMSCFNQGILLVDWQTKKIISHYKKFPTGIPISFTDMAQLPDGKWLLMTRNELIEWNPSTGQSVIMRDFEIDPSSPFNLELTSIISTGSDEFYITSTIGLFHYQATSRKVRPILQRKKMDMYSPYDLVHGVYDKGVLWLASRKGLTRYDTRIPALKNFYYPGSDSTNINFLCETVVTKNGLVLCAGAAGVLVLEPKTEKYSLINEFGSITNPSCFTIYVKDSLAWINSNAGLLHINLNLHKGSLVMGANRSSVYSPVHFGIVDDELVIGYRNLYSYFNPLQTITHVLPSAPVIEKILLNNQHFYLTEGKGNKYRFTHKQNTFSFYFTAFEFNNPADIHFRYMLEGHDKEWTHLIDQRNATYVKLPPGQYAFRLQAGNSQGEWNEQETVFRFRIIPPFWMRWWFWPLLGLLFVTAVIIVARNRINSIRKREKEKTKLAKTMAGLETRLLRSQMNPHFIFNSLNSVQKYIWENKEEDAAEYLARFSKLMRAILENSRKDSIPLEEELSIMKLYIELEHRRSNGKFEYSIRTDETLDLKNILIPPMLLQPFIENAIWHGLNKKKDAGHLFITIVKKNNMLECMIDDDGPGRPIEKTNAPDPNKQSLGVQITKERLSLLQKSSDESADIRIIDKKNNGVTSGTTVFVTIPIRYSSHA